MLCGEGARTHGITARSRVGHPKVRLWWLNGNSSGVVITTKASIGSSRISGMQTRMMLAGACWKWRDQKTVSWFLQRVLKPGRLFAISIAAIASKEPSRVD